MSDVSLHVNGREWGGWTSISISAGIDRLARDFSVQLTRRWPGDGNTDTLRLGVKNGDSVTVMIDSDPVVTGFVEATPVRYDARSVSMGIAGRSLTGDLIDCSAAPTQFDGRSMMQVAAALVQPFGISVVNAGAPTAPLLGLQVDHGETVAEVINKMMEIQQALAFDDERGNLVIGMPGTTRATTALVYGQNILTCDTEKSIEQRFSMYDVTGQRPGNDNDFGAATIAAIRSKTADSYISRYRPTVIRQTGTATTQTCKDRAEFEMRQRAARTDETTYSVQGWRQGDGRLWMPNQRVIVFDPLLGFQNDELLIAEVNFKKDNVGTTTHLRVGPPDAYLPEPADPAKQKRGKKVKEDPFFR